ncbi:MAG: hypothetical protein DRH08_10210, partial [Deltaproteobacteria bacterium]
EGLETIVAKISGADTSNGSADITTASTTTNITENDVPGKFIVGSNDDDVSGSTTLHTVPQDDFGAISGATGEDVLVGDPGGSTLQPGSTANIVLVLDTSGSMNYFIDFDGENISRLDALKLATTNALNDLAASGAQDIRVHIVRFGTEASTVGTYDISINGQDSSIQLQAAIDDVNDITISGPTQYTNYEAGLVKANEWIETSNAPLTSADINKLVFVSDGEPNYALNNDGEAIGLYGSSAAANAMHHVLGTYDVYGSQNDDNISEVSLIETAGPGTAPAFTIEAIGINVGNGALDLLSQIEGAGGSATNVTDASQLSTELGTLTGATVINESAGNDFIDGSDNADLIFGDVLNTDALANAQGLGTPEGSGWLVFQQLEAGSTGWTRVDTLDYIQNNQAELAVESGRNGGDDTIDGGAGDDVIYGQEGDDSLFGGVGNDLLHGGSGNDAFFFSANAGEGINEISDFSIGVDSNDSGDILSFADLLDDGDFGENDILAFTDNVEVVNDGTDLTLTIPDQNVPGVNNDTVVTLAGVGTDYDTFSSGTLTDLINQEDDFGNHINVDTYAS